VSNVSLYFYAIKLDIEIVSLFLEVTMKPDKSLKSMDSMMNVYVNMVILMPGNI